MVLKEIAPGVIMIMILLTTTLHLPVLFEGDYEDGVMEQYLTMPCLPSHIFIAKFLSNWVLCSLPLIIFTPIVAVLYGINLDLITRLIIALFLATPTIALIATMSGAIALGVKKNSTLYSVLALPLYIPGLIFTTGSVVATDLMTSIYGLISLLLVTLPLSILIGSHFIKNLYSK